MSYVEHIFVPADESRTPRQRRLIRAEITDSFGAKYDVVIRNVSEKGVGASMQVVPPLKGSVVTVMIPQGMAMKSTVRWIEGTACGIELENPIDLQTLTDVIQRKHQTAKREGQWEVRNLHQVNSGHFDPAKVRKI